MGSLRLFLKPWAYRHLPPISRVRVPSLLSETSLLFALLWAQVRRLVVEMERHQKHFRRVSKQE